MKTIRVLVIVVACFLITGLVGYMMRKLFFLKRVARNLNLIIISVEALRPDHMGVYGYKKNTTPNISRWAQNATIFTNVQTVVPVTYPSFIALMTGLDPFETRIFANSKAEKRTGISSIVSNNTPTLAKTIKANGYRTAAFVGNDALSPEMSNFNQGFDTYKVLTAWNSKSPQYRQYVDESIEWMKNNRNSKFFMWVHLVDPHNPYVPPEELSCIHNTQYCTLIKKEGVSYVDRRIRQKNSHSPCKKEIVSPEDISILQTLYDGEITAADKEIQQILDGLKHNGLDNNTIVVIYGDHGEGFDHDYNFAHGGVLYNSNTRIPLIIKNPAGGTAGTYDNTLIQNTDISSILISLLKIPSKNISATKSPFSHELAKRLYSFSVNYNATKFSIFDGRYKFIYSTNKICTPNDQNNELYDTLKDREEKYNIVDENVTKASQLKNELFQKLSAYNLPVLNHKEDSDKIKRIQEIKDNLKSLGY